MSSASGPMGRYQSMETRHYDFKPTPISTSVRRRGSATEQRKDSQGGKGLCLHDGDDVVLISAIARPVIPFSVSHLNVIWNSYLHFTICYYFRLATVV